MDLGFIISLILVPLFILVVLALFIIAMAYFDKRQRERLDEIFEPLNMTEEEKRNGYLC